MSILTSRTLLRRFLLELAVVSVVIGASVAASIAIIL